MKAEDEEGLEPPLAGGVDPLDGGGPDSEGDRDPDDDPDNTDDPGDPEQPGQPGEPDDELPGAGEAADLDDVLDADDDDEDDEEGEEDEDGTPTKKQKAGEEEVVKFPKTPVPTRKVMLSALKWAFEGEEGIEPGFLEACTDHALATLKANRVMNLTPIIDPKEFAAKVYLPSWRVTRLVPLMARKVVDLGSGAGFPGIPLALAEPNLSMTLIDSDPKRAEFLEGVLEKLPLKNTRVVCAKAEDYLARERVDVVLVRAVSSVRENVRTLRKVRHSLQDLVMLKANTWSREVRAAEREAERLGFKLDTVWEHELPDEMGGRAILVYRAPGGAGM